jgi:CRP/FNR family cyclic AMP-dependent transcriptional regulator
MSRSIPRAAAAAPTEPDTGPDSDLFSSTLSGGDLGDDDTPTRADWAGRSAALDAKPMDPTEGGLLLARLWRAERHVLALQPEELAHLCEQLRYVRVGRDRQVIGQNELGDFMVVVLEGTLSVDRLRAGGGLTRLAEAHPGDMVGEMAMLDAGARFCSCTTLGPCTLAVLEAPQLEALFEHHPRIGLALVATLSRRLSLRLRQVSARLSALHSAD